MLDLNSKNLARQAHVGTAGGGFDRQDVTRKSQLIHRAAVLIRTIPVFHPRYGSEKKKLLSAWRLRGGREGEAQCPVSSFFGAWSADTAQTKKRNRLTCDNLFVLSLSILSEVACLTPSPFSRPSPQIFRNVA